MNFDIDELKRGLNSKLIDLPKYQSVEERCRWLMDLMSKHKHKYLSKNFKETKMSIKLLNTKSFGQVVADVEESLTSGTIKLIKPAFVQLQQHPQTGQIGLAMMGVMTAFVDKENDYLMINADDVIGGDLVGHVPNSDVYNEYQNKFGSGLVLQGSQLIK